MAKLGAEDRMDENKVRDEDHHGGFAQTTPETRKIPISVQFRPGDCPPK